MFNCKLLAYVHDEDQVLRNEDGRGHNNNTNPAAIITFFFNQLIEERGAIVRIIKHAG